MSTVINIPPKADGHWKAPVANLAALPTSNNSSGDVRVTLDTSNVYEWNGSAWVLIGTTSPVSGSGTTDRIAKFTSSSTVGNTNWSEVSGNILSLTSGKTISVPGTGANSEQFGVSTSAGAGSVAVGKSATASGTNSIAIGYLSEVTDDGVAIGKSAGCLSGLSVVIGENASTGGGFGTNTVIGYGASAHDDGAVVIGYNSYAYFYGIAIGEQAACAGSYAIVLGRNSNSNSSNNSILIGANVTIDAADSVVTIGTGAALTGVSSDVNIGYGTTLADGVNGSVNIGTSASCGGSASVNIGDGAIIDTGASGVCIGSGASVYATVGICIGVDASIDAPSGNTILIGNGATTADSNRSVVIGTEAQANSGSALLVGFSSHITSSATNSVLLGGSSNIGDSSSDCDHNILIGNESNITNTSTYDICIGHGNTIGHAGNYSIIIGHGNDFEADNAIIIGNSNTSAANGECWIGTSTGITTYYLGKTVAGGTSPVTILPIYSTGTNIAGGALTLAGARGTGTGGGGSIIFQTAPAGSSGGSQNTLATVLTIDKTKTLTLADTANFAFNTTTGTKFGTGTTQKMGWYNKTPVAQQTDGANLTNNVTAGGTTDTIADFTNLTVYATDAATIRNDIYQLARKVKIIGDALRTYGLLS